MALNAVPESPSPGSPAFACSFRAVWQALEGWFLPGQGKAEGPRDGGFRLSGHGEGHILGHKDDPLFRPLKSPIQNQNPRPFRNTLAVFPTLQSYRPSKDHHHHFIEEETEAWKKRLTEVTHHVTQEPEDDLGFFPGPHRCFLS